MSFEHWGVCCNWWYKENIWCVYMTTYSVTESSEVNALAFGRELCFGWVGRKKRNIRIRTNTTTTFSSDLFTNSSQYRCCYSKYTLQIKPTCKIYNFQSIKIIKSSHNNKFYKLQCRQIKNKLNKLHQWKFILNFHLWRKTKSEQKALKLYPTFNHVFRNL